MKCRLLYLHRGTNPGKIERLEALHREYVAYVRICVQQMLTKRRYTLKKSERRTFFPPTKALTSQIVKNAQDHAIQIVSTWAKAVYGAELEPFKRVTLTLWKCPNLKSLAGIETAENIETISLYDMEQIEDLEPLANLTRLKFLKIRGCAALSNTSAIERIPSLKSWDVYGCPKVPDQRSGA
ncbi:MAG: hypothetical protein GF334_02345 [Candidatus Altiarchaeales archaeon]|nr:hypothetical protein [Candidatus Altiarchaeales archaeon]